MIKVGPDPVDHRHEVVAYGLYTGFPEIRKADLVIFDQLIPFRTGILDSLAYRKTLNNRPSESE